MKRENRLNIKKTLDKQMEKIFPSFFSARLLALKISNGKSSTGSLKKEVTL